MKTSFAVLAGCLTFLGAAAGCGKSDAGGAALPSAAPSGLAGAAAAVGASGTPAIAGSAGTVATMPTLTGSAGAGVAGMPSPNASAGVAGTLASAGRAAGGAGAGGTSTSNAGTMAPMPGTGDPSMCPAPPAGASADSIQALNATNAARVAAGSGCMNLSLQLDMSALSHCKYYAMNSTNSMCVSDPHGEVMSCMGFTGMDVASREKAAGYTNGGFGATEVMTFFGDMPMLAVPGWIDTVWHRIPMLSPWYTDMGYGGAQGCDTIDFGTGSTPAAMDKVVVYPYDGQTNVPPSFSGREGPMPPTPTTGWPSSYPISIYAQGINVTSHVLMKDGDTTPLDHVWMDQNNPMIQAGYKGYLQSVVFLYGNAPFMPNTKYRVQIMGTHTGGALNLEWTFTTGAANPFGP